MKHCVRCGKTYDDSWGQCPDCQKPLAAGTSGAFEKNINGRLQRLEERLQMVEMLAGITPAKETEPVRSVKAAAPASAAPAPTRTAPVRKEKDIESTIGLVWLNRIGVVALLMGAAFFLKYAFDNQWIGELGRVVMGLAMGLGLIVGSEICRKKRYDTMSQGLQGAGTGFLYLSIYAAFGFYHLIPAMAAFGFLSVVTLYCGFWAVRTDWKSSALIGLAGGFLTPFLIGFDKISPVLLCSYVVMLDLGVLYIALSKRWKALDLIALFLTHAVFVTIPQRHQPESWLMMLGFATIYFILFSLLPVIQNLVRREKAEGEDLMLIGANALMFLAHAMFLLKPHLAGIYGITPLVLGAVYLGFAYSALRRSKADSNLVLIYSCLSILFVTIAIPVQLKENWVVISWAIEAVLIVWVGFRMKNPSIRKAGLAVGALSFFGLFFIDRSGATSGYLLFWNERTLTYLVEAASLFFVSWLYRREDGNLEPGEKSLSTTFMVLGNLLLLANLYLEVHAFFDHLTASSKVQYLRGRNAMFGARELTISALAIAYGFVNVAVGFYRRSRALRILGLAILGVAIFKIFLFDLSQLDRIFRIVSFMGLGIMLMIASFFYQKHKDRIIGFVKD